MSSKHNRESSHNNIDIKHGKTDLNLMGLVNIIPLSNQTACNITIIMSSKETQLLTFFAIDLAEHDDPRFPLSQSKQWYIPFSVTFTKPNKI